jgi:hypothetical protein
MASSIYEFHAKHIADAIEARLGVEMVLVMDNATRVTKNGVGAGATALVSTTGYSSFSGEWQAGSRPVRLTPSYRHVFALAQLAPRIH